MCVLRHSISNEFVPPCLQVHRVSNLKERFNGGKDCIPGLYKTSKQIVCWSLVLWFPGKVWLDEFCCFAFTNLQHNLLFFCLREMLEKTNPQLRSDKKVNDSATQTHPTQRHTQAKLSHPCTIRSAMHAEPTKWRTQTKISHAHTSSSPTHTA